MTRLLLTLGLVFFTSLFITAQAQLFEDFETGVKPSYAPGTITLNSGDWQFDEALIGSLAGDKKNGARSARIRAGSITMLFDKTGGAGEISFYYASYGTDAGGNVHVSISDDGGANWDLISELSTTSTLQLASILVNTPDDIRLRIAFPNGSASPNNRLNIDDIRITNFEATTEEPQLVVDLGGPSLASGSSYDFGIVNTGSEKTTTVRLRNLGEELLQISEGVLDGTGFSTDAELTNIELGLFESIEFDVTFSPDMEDSYQGSLVFNSNDPETPVFTLLLTGTTPSLSEPITIAEARALPQGTVVTVAGWITVTDQFRGPVYFQDETAGIAWFNNNDMRIDWNIDALIGDSVVVTGQLGNFNNLLQVINEISYTIYPESNREIEPLDINTIQLNSGDYESQLVRLTDLNITGSGTFSGGTNYVIADAVGSSQMRVDAFSNIGGTNIPNEPVNLTGVAGRFQASRQILPRFTEDIDIIGGGPVITSAAPYEIFATPGSITFSWETEGAGHSEVRYGLTDSFELGNVIDEAPKTVHSITVDNLEPATIYRVQLRSAIGTDTSSTSAYITSTASPSGASGDILVFFNQSTQPELATYQQAVSNENFSTRLISYIDAAEETADFAFYSISGTVGDQVSDRIIQAHQRGVDVRVIASGHTGNPNAVITKLVNAGVKATLSLGQNQHHNKFAVIDAHHEDPSKSWVVTSSWNATDDGTNNQHQNMINIQDVALARAYLQEFNQMWGAESGSFNASNARFSENKVVVNPSVFWVGEDQTQIRLYFSPQGSTESQISRALSTAQTTIDLGLNLITRRSLSNTMLSRFNDGVKVRGVLGQITGEGSEWDYLSSWADVHHFPQAQFGLLHHKYAIVDGENTTSNSKVITGSHNWSANANLRNDENTLIIYSGSVANEYLQEFAARYTQAGGQDVFVAVSVDGEGTDLPEAVTLSQNYPNPFNPTTNIRFQLNSGQNVTLDVFDIMGRRVATLAENRGFSPGEHTLMFDASNLSSGMYIYQLRLDSGQTLSRKMMLVK
jgi:phosphatidylserine/phosphatidylglycerophosphate/cardiolipin synthase-like enzyme